jgi:adenylate cyclase, class 2
MKNNHFTFRAKVNNLEELENKLVLLEAILIRTSHYIDTYFETAKGTLKLREARRQTILINYENKRINSRKSDDIIVYNHRFSNALKNILMFQFGIDKVITMKRKIYNFENVQLQLDVVQDLGDFIQVEILNAEGTFTELQLANQYEFFWEFFEIHPKQQVYKSYYELSATSTDQNASQIKSNSLNSDLTNKVAESIS